MIDEAEVGQIWEVSSAYVAGMPQRRSHFLVLEHTDENVIMDPSGAWIMLDLETGEIRLRTRLYSDIFWKKIL